MSDKFVSTLQKIIEKNKATFDEDSYKLKVSHSSGDSFEIDLKNLKKSGKKNIRESVSNFR